MKRKQSPVSRQRVAFERRTLRELAALNASPEELKAARELLHRGRKTAGLDYAGALNLAASERAGIEYVKRCLSGNPPLAVIVRMNPCPEVQPHG